MVHFQSMFFLHGRRRWGSILHRRPSCPSSRVPLAPGLQMSPSLKDALPILSVSSRTRRSPAHIQFLSAVWFRRVKPTGRLFYIGTANSLLSVSSTVPPACRVHKYLKTQRERCSIGGPVAIDEQRA